VSRGNREKKAKVNGGTGRPEAGAGVRPGKSQLWEPEEHQVPKGRGNQPYGERANPTGKGRGPREGKRERVRYVWVNSLVNPDRQDTIFRRRERLYAVEPVLLTGANTRQNDLQKI